MRRRARRLALLAGAIAALGAQAACARAATATCAVDPARGLKLSFDEPFDRLRLYDGTPGSGWRPEYGYTAPGTLDSRTLPGEREVYVDPAFKGTGAAPLGLNPFAIHGGVLDITARPTPPALAASVWNRPYVSGLLTSKFLFQQRYGYFEARLKLPAGAGLFPAFWLLRQDAVWPPEIDVMESLGDPAYAFATLISKASGTRTTDQTNVHIVADPDGFHRFGVLWTPTDLVWYVDGAEVKRAPTPSDLNAPMFLLVNLAVGHPWPGYPKPDFISATLQVDSIRAWALPDGPFTPPPMPKGCAPPAEAIDHPPKPPGHR